jgi:hygromycin-B 7''-O-kinase
MREVCRRHGLDASLLEPMPVGSNVVFAAGTRVVKAFAPFWPREHDAERALLRAVEGRVGVPTPALEAEGELDGWRYLVLGRVGGRPVDEVRSAMSAEDDAHVLRQVGGALRRLHAIEVPGLRALGPAWPELLQAQRAGFRKEQRLRGLSPEWIELAEAWLSTVFAGLPREPVVAVHADVTWENVFVERRPGDGRWEVTGLIDFADATSAHPEYDLVSPTSHWTTGRADLYGAFLDGYGLPPSDRTPALADRLLALVLLHRFARLGRITAAIPPGPAEGRREVLRDVLFPMGWNPVRAQECSSA